MSADSATATLAPARDMGTIDKVYILFLLLLVYISNYADRILLGILLPAIKAEFHLTDFQLAACFKTRSRLFRIAAYEDLRHLLKHKRSYAASALTPRGDRRRRRGGSSCARLSRGSSAAPGCAAIS